MKTTLTKQQSQHLIDLGVPKEKASIKHIELMLEEYRVFSLSDLLEILPKEIEEGDCPMEMIWEQEESMWNCIYSGLVSQMSEELIDALYQLCVWCLENKFI